MPVFSVRTDKTWKMDTEGEERKRIKEKEIESESETEREYLQEREGDR